MQQQHWATSCARGRTAAICALRPVNATLHDDMIYEMKNVQNQRAWRIKNATEKIWKKKKENLQSVGQYCLELTIYAEGTKCGLKQLRRTTLRCWFTRHFLGCCARRALAGSLSCGGHCPESAATKAHTAPTREQRWMALSVPGLLNAATQKNTGAENEDTKGAMTMMCVERGRRAGRREGVCPLVQERLL